MVTYDATTANGIGYISRLYLNNSQYMQIVDDLDALKPVRMQIMSGGGGVQSYSVGSRSLTRAALSATELLDLWDTLMSKKLGMERGKARRKAVGAVMRDW